MGTLFSSVPCIIVDWDTYTNDDSDIGEYLADKSEFFDVVVFVADAQHNDYNASITGWDATAVIRNSVENPMEPHKFKMTAFATLQDGSNLMPVVAFERDLGMKKFYNSEGLLAAWNGFWFDIEGPR